jgi:hypothetical protein
MSLSATIWGGKAIVTHDVIKTYLFRHRDSLRPNYKDHTLSEQHGKIDFRWQSIMAGLMIDRMNGGHNTGGWDECRTIDLK